MSNDYKRLLKNIIALIILGTATTLGYFYFFQNEDKLTIDDTPIRIESIRTIAEINTISYKDEVVVDTVEYYDAIHSLYDPREWFRMYDRNVKRRLTLIVKGEVKYGVDLTNNDYQLDNREDTISLTLPQPKILDVIITPSETEVFQEQGDWTDANRRQLEAEAKHKLVQNAKQFKLSERAKENTIRMFKKLIQTDKHLIIEFHEK